MPPQRARSTIPVSGPFCQVFLCTFSEKNGAEVLRRQALPARPVEQPVIPSAGPEKHRLFHRKTADGVCLRGLRSGRSLSATRSPAPFITGWANTRICEKPRSVGSRNFGFTSAETVEARRQITRKESGGQGIPARRGLRRKRSEHSLACALQGWNPARRHPFFEAAHPICTVQSAQQEHGGGNHRIYRKGTVIFAGVY